MVGGENAKGQHNLFQAAVATDSSRLSESSDPFRPNSVGKIAYHRAIPPAMASAVGMKLRSIKMFYCSKLLQPAFASSPRHAGVGRGPRRGAYNIPPFHKPPGEGTGPTGCRPGPLSRRTERFMVPMHGIKAMEAFHEPQSAAGILPADQLEKSTAGKMPAAPRFRRASGKAAEDCRSPRRGRTRPPLAASSWSQCVRRANRGCP